MKPALALMALAVAACSNLPSAEERATYLRDMRTMTIGFAQDDCRAIGHPEGTAEFTGCVERRAASLYQQETASYDASLRDMANDEANRRMAAAAILGGVSAGSAAYGAGLGQYQAPPQPMPQIRCQTFGAVTRCM